VISKSIEEAAELIANSSPEDAKAIMDAHPTKIMVFGHHIPDFLLLMGNKMKDDEYRALVEAGPAVVMVAKEDMLKLLDRLIQANQTIKPPLVQVPPHEWEYALERFGDMEKEDRKKVRHKKKVSRNVSIPMTAATVAREGRVIIASSPPATTTNPRETHG